MKTTKNIQCIPKHVARVANFPVSQWRGLKMSSRNLNHADIVVAGGGMVGTSLACALGCSEAFKNRKVYLLEAGPETLSKDWKKSPFENRVSAITPGSKSFFKDIGVWNKIVERRYHPFQNMHVWDACSSGNISFNSKDVNQEHIAYIIENSVVVESLTEAAKKLLNVQIMYGARINKVEFPLSEADTCYTEDLVTVHLQNGEAIQTKLLVGADGFNSFVRNSANMQTYDYDYGQSAVVATLKIKSTKNSQNETAWQRFLHTGPVALLPLHKEYSSLVWSTSKDQAKKLIELSEEEFITSVNDVIHSPPESNEVIDVVSGYTKAIMSTIQPGRYASNFLISPPLVTKLEAGSRGMFPLGLKHSTHYVKSRLALVGDAAHRVHPMAGQGVNLGFGDVQCLVKVLHKAVEYGEDIGSLETLLPYETERQRHVIPVVSAINALNGLFSSKQTLVILARSFGLQATDILSPVKEQIVKYAMG